EREQAEVLNMLPDFWMLVPTPASLSDVKLQTTQCHRVDPAHPLTAIPARSVQSTPAIANGEAPEPKCKVVREDEQSGNKQLSNNSLVHRLRIFEPTGVSTVMKPCSHVTYKTCNDTLATPAKQCFVCNVKLGGEDINAFT
ncbi:hypothetical protein LXA43DRAFT_898130, partial [Ganoderma leucocontextum]